MRRGSGDGRRRGGRQAGAAAAVLLPLLAGVEVRGATRPGGVAPACTGARIPVAPPARSLVRARFLMGTRLVIEARGPAAEAAVEAAFREVGRLDAILSNWRADSELSRLNRTAASGPVTCSPDLFAAVTAALRWAAETGGTFDPTVEPLVGRLGLREPADLLPGMPAGDGVRGDLDQAGKDDPSPPVIGWRHVRVDALRRSVAFDRPGVGIDLGGIGKGFALDAARRVLADAGVDAALLDFGGQVLVLGDGPDREAWVVSIADPEDRDLPAGVLRLEKGSASTSGNGERAVNRGGKLIGHLLDPVSGNPADFTGTVTVLARDGASADALSTALFVMGPTRGLAWAEAHRVAALFLSREGHSLRRWSTRGFPVSGLSEGGSAEVRAAAERGRPPGATSGEGGER